MPMGTEWLPFEPPSMSIDQQQQQQQQQLSQCNYNFNCSQVNIADKKRKICPHNLLMERTSTTVASISMTVQQVTKVARGKILQ